LIVENPKLSIIDGAIPFFNMGYSNYYSQLMRSLAQEYSFDLNMPFKDLDEEIKKIILYGTGKKKINIRYRNHKGHIRVYSIKFEGLANNLSRRYLETESDYQRNKIEKMVAKTPCHSCQGKRLKKESLAVKVNGTFYCRFLRDDCRGKY